NPHVKVAVLSVYEHRCYDLADVPIIFRPQTDLAILNYIANYIITNKRVNQDFVAKHVTFKRATEDIGYGLRPEHPLEKKAKNVAKAAEMAPMTFDEFAAYVKPYTASSVSKLSCVPEDKLRAPAELYPDPKVKLMSF